jgi:hypothetical protein
MDADCASLKGRGILLIGIGFYDYEHAIAAEMQRQGATVFLYDELPFYLRRGPVASLSRRWKIDVSKLVRKHQEKILSEIPMHQISQVLIIKGEHIKPWFLDALRSASKRVELIAYHWDSVLRYPKLVDLQVHFDRIYTFDLADAKRFPKFKFRPLFFRSEIGRKIDDFSVEQYDLCFVGWHHHRRLLQLNEIYKWASEQGLRTFFHVYTGLASKFRLCLMSKGRFVKPRSIKFEEYVKLMHHSRVIVDLPHPDQSGLTMRAMEAIGANRKLITTSPDIRLYDFYRPENVFVIDPISPKIDTLFIQAPMVELSEEIRIRYSLRSWVLDVLSEDCRSDFLNDTPQLGQSDLE